MIGLVCMSQYQNRLNRKSRRPGIILALMTLPLRPQQSDPPAGGIRTIRGTRPRPAYGFDVPLAGGRTEQVEWRATSFSMSL